MSRLTTAWDRIATFLAGLVLFALGAAAVAWYYRLVSAFPTSLHARTATRIMAQGWWPWAAGAVGVLLVLLGLRWLVAHLPQRRSHRLALTGSDRTGRLTADLSAVSQAAAEAMTDVPGVRSTGSAVHVDRGRRTLDITATVEQHADLAALVDASERMTAELRQVLGADAPATRVHLRVARTERNQPRVR